MKKIYFYKLTMLLLIIAFSRLSSIAQSDDPAAASGYIQDSQDFWYNTPQLVLAPESALKTLPDEVNNSDYFYFPYKEENGEIKKYIYVQDGTGSCAAVSTVFYTFTYEINRVHGVPGLFDENKYPPNFTWNFLNDGIGANGSSFEYNLNILKGNGVPNGVDWGNFEPHDTLRWMDGYEKYHNSHYNRIDTFFQISPLYTPEKLLILKHWIADHNEAGDFGGLAVFSTDGACTEEVILPTGSAHAGEEAIVEWGTLCGHAMTIVGYCDSVKWDFNEDGQFTNNIDLNGDNTLDVRDWEIGAFNIVGEEKPWQAQEGFVWIMYKTVCEMINSQGPRAIVMHVKENYEPELEVKVKVKHDYREFFGAKLNWTENADDYNFINESVFIDKFYFFDGGAFHLHGIDDNPIEISLDFSFWFIEENFGKIFYRPRQITNGLYNDTGLVEYMSIVDYRWGEEFEIFSDQENIPVISSYTNIFVDYDLIPHESDIEENLTLSTDMVSRFMPTVSNGATLTIENGINIDMYTSEIHINQNSSLVIEDNVTFTAKSGICKIIVNGNIQLGSNVNFFADEGADINLVIDNLSLVSTFSDATFERGILQSNQSTLTLVNCNFSISGGINFTNGNLTINSCDFDHAILYAANASAGNKQVNVTNHSTFTGFDGYAINIDNYPNYSISNNTLTSNITGIGIFRSGSGRTRIITNNTITGNGNGIVVYNSTSTISSNSLINNGNIISDNYVGLRSLDRSHVNLTGYADATLYNETQQIKDNIYEEVLATEGSFPCPFRSNAIIDDDNTGNPDDPLVRYTTGLMELLDVRLNYWGTNFNYQQDLNPYPYYIWEPVWELNGFGGGDASESVYDEAEEKIDQEDFVGAKILLQELVSTYPDSKYAEASLKELLHLEAYSGGNYIGLKAYYDTDSTIQNNIDLTKLADFLANFCDIKLENYPTAIAWFEDVIQNPESFEDSIFAIIDLGYTYFLMENGGQKSSYVGNMPQYKPVTVEQFEENRDYLLSLLPGDKLSEAMKESINALKTGELLQNVPNPFNNSTQIWYKLDEEAVVAVNVFDYTGKRVSTINAGRMDKGSHFVEFSSVGLPAGIYFYSLEVNGWVSDSRKMTVVK